MKSQNSFILVIALFLGSCVTPPDYASPLTGIANEAAISSFGSPTRIQAGGKSLGLILSDNTEKALVYLDEVGEMANAWGGGKRLIQDRDPVFLVDRVVALLKPKFSSIVIADNLADATIKGSDLAIVIDLQTELGQMSGDKTQVRLEGIFLDLNGALLNRAEGSGEAKVPWPATNFNFQKASEGALETFAVSLDEVLY